MESKPGASPVSRSLNSNLHDRHLTILIAFESGLNEGVSQNRYDIVSL